MDLLVNTSLITSFLAGAGALFAPCCITVLLPTYFASIFRHKRRVLLMTFVFFLGILVVFLPLGLGFGGLGALLSDLHDWIYLGGALFMLLLAASSLGGFHPTLPLRVTPGLAAHNTGAILGLGVFSGLATTCCAPVLAGVLALAALPGSVFWGGMYSLGYVLGMVTPLFVIAFFLDKVNFTDKFLLFKKSVRLAGKEIACSNLLAGMMFAGMGGLILYLYFTGGLIMDGGSAVQVNIMIARYVTYMSGILQSAPGFVMPLFFLLLALLIASLVRRYGIHE